MAYISPYNYIPSNPVEFQAPDMKFLSGFLKHKQDKYESSFNRLASLKAGYMALDLLNQEDQDNLNNLNKNVSNWFETNKNADYSDYRTIEDISSQYNKIATDPGILSGMQKTQEFRQQLANIEQSRKNKNYSSTSAANVMMSLNKYKNATGADKQSASAHQYVPDCDYTENWRKLVKTLKPDISAEFDYESFNKAGHAFQNITKGVSAKKITNAVLGSLDDCAKSQIREQTFYDYNTNPNFKDNLFEQQQTKLIIQQSSYKENLDMLEANMLKLKAENKTDSDIYKRMEEQFGSIDALYSDISANIATTPEEMEQMRQTFVSKTDDELLASAPDIYAMNKIYAFAHGTEYNQSLPKLINNRTMEWNARNQTALVRSQLSADAKLRAEQIRNGTINTGITDPVGIPDNFSDSPDADFDKVVSDYKDLTELEKAERQELFEFLKDDPNFKESLKTLTSESPAFKDILTQINSNEVQSSILKEKLDNYSTTTFGIEARKQQIDLVEEDAASGLRFQGLEVAKLYEGMRSGKLKEIGGVPIPPHIIESAKKNNLEDFLVGLSTNTKESFISGTDAYTSDIRMRTVIRTFKEKFPEEFELLLTNARRQTLENKVQAYIQHQRSIGNELNPQEIAVYRNTLDRTAKNLGINADDDILYNNIPDNVVREITAELYKDETMRGRLKMPPSSFIDLAQTYVSNKKTAIENFVGKKANYPLIIPDPKHHKESRDSQVNLFLSSFVGPNTIFPFGASDIENIVGNRDALLVNVRAPKATSSEDPSIKVEIPGEGDAPGQEIEIPRDGLVHTIRFPVRGDLKEIAYKLTGAVEEDKIWTVTNNSKVTPKFKLKANNKVFTVQVRGAVNSSTRDYLISDGTGNQVYLEDYLKDKKLSNGANAVDLLKNVPNFYSHRNVREILLVIKEILNKIDDNSTTTESK